MAELHALLEAALGTRYRIERELGGGGMSCVFVAEELRFGRTVVINPSAGTPKQSQPGAARASNT